MGEINPVNSSVISHFRIFLLTVLTAFLIAVPINTAQAGPFVCTMPGAVCQGMMESDRTATSKTIPKIIKRIKKSIGKFKELMGKLTSDHRQTASAQSAAQAAIFTEEAKINSLISTGEDAAKTEFRNKEQINKTTKFTDPTLRDCMRVTAQGDTQSEILTEAAKKAAQDYNSKIVSNHTDTIWGRKSREQVNSEYLKIISAKYCHPDANTLGDLCTADPATMETVGSDLNIAALLFSQGTWASTNVEEAADLLKIYLLGPPPQIINPAGMAQDGGARFMDTKAYQARRNLASYLIEHVASKRKPTVSNGNFIRAIINEQFGAMNEEDREIFVGILEDSMIHKGKSNSAAMMRILTNDRFLNTKYFTRDNFDLEGGIGREVVFNAALMLKQNYEMMIMEEQFVNALAVHYAQSIN